MTDDPVRLLIADDHPVFRGGLKMLVDSLDTIELAGEAANGEEAIALARDLQPDVVLMDLHMPGVNGIEATRAIVGHEPAHRRAGADDVPGRRLGLRRHAGRRRGYLLKGAGQEEIVRGVAAVAGGEAIFGPEIAGKVIEYFTVPRSSHVEVAFPELTARERDVLELIAQGRNNAWIARHFVLSEKTIRNHVSNIFNKLQVADRAEAIVRAREAGMGQTSGSTGA